MENKPNQPEVTLRVTRTETTQQSDPILTPEQLEKEMAGALNEKVNTLGFEQIMKMPMISGAIAQGIQMLPMGIEKAKEYFENGKVSIRIYYDPFSGAFVFEKLREENVNMTYIQNTPREDFFFIRKEDQENPQAFIKTMQTKIGFNLF